MAELSVQKALAQAWEDSANDSNSPAVVPTIEEAVELVEALAGGRPAQVLVTGSLHLVGGLLEVLDQRNVLTKTYRNK
jgi:folylpolyglutamate synthase